MSRYVRQRNRGKYDAEVVDAALSCRSSSTGSSMGSKSGLYIYIPGKGSIPNEDGSNIEQYFIRYEVEMLKNVSCEYDRWVVETQLCKLIGT